MCSLWLRLPYFVSSIIMKTALVFVFRRRLPDVLIKTNIFTLLICLQDVLIKTNIFDLDIRLQDVFRTFLRRLQDVFKSFLRCLQDVLLRRFQDVFKTFWRLFITSSIDLLDVLQRSLQDLFKTYHRVKLFLLTPFQDVCETYSKHFWDVVQRRLSREGFA